MALQKWKKISEKLLLDHPRIKIYEDTVEIPSGTRTSYVRFGHEHNAATVIARRDDGKFLVQREYSYPPNEIMWQWPGGGVPLNEDPAAGANRELAEESGFTGDMQKIGEYCLNNRRSAARMYFFLATNPKQATKSPDPEEFIEDHWLTAKQIERLISEGNALNPHFMAGWTFYLRSGL